MSRRHGGVPIVSRLLLAIAFVATSCGGGGNGSAASPTGSGPTEQPEPSPTPPPTPLTVTDEELASADIVLITGETRRDLELGGFGFEGEAILSPGPTINVTAGEPITLVLQNIHGYLDDELIPHNFTVVSEKDESAEPLWGAQTENIDRGEADLISFTPDAPGEYFYICSIIGHMSGHGMWGRFVVR